MRDLPSLPPPPLFAELDECAQLPSRLPSYLRALAGAFKPREAGSFPPLGLQVRGVQVDALRVARFRRCFGLPAEGPVPPTYAHVLAAPLQLAVLTDPRFPLRVLGTVHLRNPIRQQRALLAGERVDLGVQPGQPREVAAGLEYELSTVVHDAAGQLIWHGVSVHLLRRPGPSRVRAAVTPADAPAPAWERAWRLWLPAGTGRAYAALSGDWNPIHLSLVSARLFGFRRAIVHGMWSYARVLAVLEPELRGGPLALDVRFRRPLLLPGAATIRARRHDDRRGWEWVLQDARGQSLHAEGEVIEAD